ncbi:hypothetical protein BD410DRAFT_738658 [Rickenella mellea]|uniref:Uncharacterized protein n=1 Tax=Rickenella mellea TaxID=50990 RepID=A0A4Y7QNL9_9AGAM|nr:hypothetical protein BD410DRAFT_738658 [Rickenella mellea]
MLPVMDSLVSSSTTRAKLFWQRISFSKITIFYFLFSVIHCFVQVVFQVQAFSINAEAAAFLTGIIKQGDALDNGFAVMDASGLRFCHTPPTSFSTQSCELVWSRTRSNGTAYANAIAASAEQPQVSTSYSPSSTTSPEIAAALPSTVVPAVGDVYVTSVPVSSGGAAVTKTITVFATRPSTGPSGDQPVNKGDSTPKAKRATSVPGLVTATAVNVNGTREVTINGLGWNDQVLQLNQTCLRALNWPVQKLDNTKREDITFISFQFWVLGMSIVAILNESMPHIIASLLTHILATAWGGFQIKHTADFHSQFATLTTQGACKPYNLLPNYWKQRAEAEIPSLALNALALFLSAFLSWRLVKLFGWQTFKRVGASRTINRVYKLVLGLSIAIQLSLFFVVSAIALWIDQLCNGAIGHLALKPTLYKTMLTIVLILLPLWLGLGWVSVRRELKIPMLIFLAMSTGYLAGLGGMFASTTFRWTFVQWRFYSLILSGSVLLIISTLILGIMCRLNFGKGLPRYLKGQEPLDDEFSSDNGSDDDSEKVSFPSANGPVPTFSVAFGKGDEVPPPSQMRFGPPRLAPRFINPPQEPFEPQPTQLSPPPPRTRAANITRTRSHSNASSRSDGSSAVYMGGVAAQQPVGLTRQDTRDSQRSVGSNGSQESNRSYYSDDSIHSDRYAQRSKRWVIE